MENRGRTANRRGQRGANARSRLGWDGCLSVLERRRISPVRREWHVPRLVAVRPTRVGEVSVEQVTGFFLKHARERRLTDWQFRQMVDAVQLLPVDLAQAPVDSPLDWDYWKEARSALKGGHATVAARMQAQDCLGRVSPCTWQIAGLPWSPSGLRNSPAWSVAGYRGRTTKPGLCHIGLSNRSVPGDDPPWKPPRGFMHPTPGPPGRCRPPWLTCRSPGRTYASRRSRWRPDATHRRSRRLARTNRPRDRSPRLSQ